MGCGSEPRQGHVAGCQCSKVVGASSKRKVVRHLISYFGISERRACQVIRFARSVARYESKRPLQESLRRRIRELAMTRVRYGYKRIHILLKREGIHVNKKRVHRLYCLEGLQLRQKRPKRRVAGIHRQRDLSKATRPNEAWAMDFMADQLSDGTRIRILTVVDTFTRECLSAEPRLRQNARDVVDTLKQIVRRRGKPEKIFCDNGSEFSGYVTDLWAYQQQVKLAFSRPGKPTDNAYIESFNGSIRDECLNCHWFDSLEDAKLKIGRWRKDYNESRPHRALNNLSPLEYREKMKFKPASLSQ